FSRDWSSDVCSSDLVSAIASVEVVDERTLDIVTAEPFAPLLAHLAHPVTAIVPVSHGDALARQPVGSGPYVFESWTQGDSVVLRSEARRVGNGRRSA